MLPTNKEDTAYLEFKKARENRKDVNGDYIPVRLSTKGKVYAPPLFHIKNFTVAEVLDISLSDLREIPTKVLNYLSKNVLEEDVDIGGFTKEEYVETVFNFFKFFYSSSIKGHTYNLQPSDYTYLQNMNGGPESPEYLKILRDLKDETWVPKFNLELNTIKTHDIGPDFIQKATIRKGNFSYAYGLPSFRDLIDLEDFIHIIFREEEARFESTEKIIKLRTEQLKKRLEGENIPLESIPMLPKTIEAQYNDFNYKRQLYYSRAIRAAYLREYQGEDLSKYPIEEKMKLIADNRIDLKNYTEFVAKTREQSFGLNKQVNIISPITSSPTSYSFSLDSLVALKPFETKNLLELLVSLSKNTANSLTDLMQLPMDKVLAYHNTLANLAEKEREESEKQKDEQLASTKGMLKNPGFNMSGIQGQMSQMGKMASSFTGGKAPTLPSIKF